MAGISLQTQTQTLIPNPNLPVAVAVVAVAAVDLNQVGAGVLRVPVHQAEVAVVGAVVGEAEVGEVGERVKLKYSMLPERISIPNFIFGSPTSLNCYSQKSQESLFMGAQNLESSQSVLHTRSVKKPLLM
jgi:hypothetical protein